METTDQTADQQELERLRAQAREFQPLETIAEALRADPSKIYAIQAALSGQGQAPQQAQPAPQQRVLTAEELQELNQRALTNPAEFMAAVAKQAVAEGLQGFAQQASPYMATTAELSIDVFKNSKSSQPMYKATLPFFDKELRDIDRASFLQMAPAARTRQLEMRWAAAKASAYDAAVAAGSQGQAPNLGGGGSGGGAATPPPKKSIFEKDPTTFALTQRLIDSGQLSKEDVEALEAEMEAQDN